DASKTPSMSKNKLKKSGALSAPEKIPSAHHDLPASRHKLTTETSRSAHNSRKNACKNHPPPSRKKSFPQLQHPVKNLRNVAHSVHRILVVHPFRPDNPNRSPALPAHSRRRRN